MNRRVLLSLAVVALVGCSKPGGAPAKPAVPATPAEGPWSQKAMDGQELYATFKTSLGPIVVKLFAKEAPNTVRNFVGLATGEREWTNPATGEKKKGVPLYSGTVFHRVIPAFMIQGGDPLGSGTGSPGYNFADETSSGRTFEKTGLLAMANAGPNTNGSQFFITVSKPTYLNGKHTIFGEVLKGYEVAEAIANTPRDRRDKPLQPVIIEQISLSDTLP